jgi:hypothetical protein
MPKISVNNSDKNNKSCGILHSEFNKIEFAFFWFSYDFLQILQDSAIHMYYWEPNSAQVPEKFLDSQAYP